jgi:hypothetical protein
MNPLTHAQARAFIQAAADDLLNSSQQQTLQAHLESCLECQAYAAEIQALQITLTRSLQNHWGEPQLSPQSVDRLVQGVKRGLAPRAGGAIGRTGKLMLGLAGLAILGIIMLALILGIGTWRVASRLRTPSPSASATRLETTITATPEVENTKTAQASPTLTATPTQTVCQVEAVVNLFCRAGPGSVYKDLDSFIPGQTAPIIGQSLDAQYWYVIGPNLGPVCTVPTGPAFVIVHGENCGVAPRFTPPPTPRPTEAPQTARPQCDDDIDNDGDGRTDFVLGGAGVGDRECTSANDNDEARR